MSDWVLSVRNLSAGYGGDKVISQIQFDVGRGEILGIVGESGSGKSTLLKALMPHEKQGTVIEGGEIVFGEDAMCQGRRGEQGLCQGHIGMIFQNPGASFHPVRTFRKQFAEALKSHGRYHRETFEETVLEVFDNLNLADGKSILDSCPYEMSGGMNQRIAIALAVLLKPSLLLADEPTSALDVVSQEQVVEEFQHMRRHYRMSMVLVSHNIEVVARLADRIGVMYEGRLVELEDTRKLLTNPGHTYTQRLLAAIPTIGPGSWDKWGQEASEEESSPLLEVEDVSKEFHRQGRVHFRLSNIRLNLYPGEILGIVGESGSGKSTLLRQISGLQRVTGGSIRLKGHTLSHRRTRQELGRIQMIFQDPYASFHPKRTIGASIMEYGRNLRGIRDKKELERELEEVMKSVGLSPDLARRYPGQVSGGQCQRAAIARALIVRPDLLLCDEITSALDVSVQAETVRLLEGLSHRYHMGILFISHDIALVGSLCRRMAVMHEGRCIEEGRSEDILTCPREEYTGILVRAAMGKEAVQEGD